MLGINPDFESEDPVCHPYPPNDADEDEPAADVEPQLPQPRVRIHEGQEDYESFCGFIDLCPWHILLCFDKHRVIDKLDSLEECTQFIWRLRTIPNAKIIVISYIRFPESAPRTFDWTKVWSSVLHRCDAIVFVLDRPVPLEGVTVWLQRSVGFRNILMCSGTKGHFLGLMGRPCILFDDKYANLESLARLAHPLCQGIRVDPPVYHFHRRDAINHRTYMTLNSPHAWVQSTVPEVYQLGAT